MISLYTIFFLSICQFHSHSIAQRLILLYWYIKSKLVLPQDHIWYIIIQQLLIMFRSWFYVLYFLRPHAFSLRWWYFLFPHFWGILSHNSLSLSFWMVICINHRLSSTKGIYWKAKKNTKNVHGDFLLSFEFICNSSFNCVSISLSHIWDIRHICK